MMMTDTESEPNLHSWSFANTPESLADENSPSQPKDSNQCLYNVDDNEPLQNAVDKFKETGDMIHIVKQELRWHLLYKRSKEGKEDINTEENTPKHYKLREEEITKIKRRREQNRMAAQRCRQRKKNKMIDLEESIKRLWNQLHASKEENSRLRVENVNLKMEVQQYRRYAQNMTFNYHGSCHQTDNYLSPMLTTMPSYAPNFTSETADMVF